MYRLLLIVLLLTGCAHLTTYSGVLGGIDTIAIPFADNLTAEAAVADSLTFKPRPRRSTKTASGAW